MAWNSLIKNLFGGDNNDTVMEEVAGETRPRYENLSGNAFKKQLEASDKAMLLDVRTAGEFANGTIRNAKNIDYLSPAFAQKIQKLDKDTTYFLFCLSGNRSGQACKMMLKQGFDVRNLSGGIGTF